MELMWHNRQYVIESVSKAPKSSSCKESYSHDVLQKQGANIVPQSSKINKPTKKIGKDKKLL